MSARYKVYRLEFMCGCVYVGITRLSVEERIIAHHKGRNISLENHLLGNIPGVFRVLHSRIGRKLAHELESKEIVKHKYTLNRTWPARHKLKLNPCLYSK